MVGVQVWLRASVGVFPYACIIVSVVRIGLTPISILDYPRPHHKIVPKILKYS